MTDPIITDEELRIAQSLYGSATPKGIALALAQARAEGRLAGMEEAATIAYGFLGTARDSSVYALPINIAKAIRARTTKEG